MDDLVLDDTLPGRFAQMAPIDLIGIGLLALLVGLGLWRGLWWQALRLVGLVAAVLVARIFSPETSLWVMEQWNDLPYRLAHGLAWLVIFLLTLGAASILGMLGQRIIEAMQLGWANRIGGGLLGAATGVLVHLVAVVLVVQLAPARFIETQVAGTYTERLVQAAGIRWSVALGKDASAEVDYLLRGRPAGEAPVAPQPRVR